MRRDLRPRSERWWQGASEPADFFDAKGVVEGLLQQTRNRGQI